MKKKLALSDLPDWPRMMDARTAAAYLGVSETVLTGRANSGYYPAPMRDGTMVRWDRHILDRWLDGRSGLQWGQSI